VTLPAWPDAPADALERELLDAWAAEDLFRRTEAAGRDGEPFVFFEGPPTANGRPGIHHVFSRSIKDLVCRFHAMQGKRVTRIAGWDTHGLPVEIEVEKQLGLSGKKDIERFGVAEFNRLCRESVFRYRADWEQLSDRIGYWLDYDHAYVTCSNEYVESVWWLLHRLHERGLLVRGHRVLPYCPRCGTVLSSHELALGYEEVQDRSIYVAFELDDGSGEELVVWTTTPWTLPSNVAVAVRPDLEYGLYALPGEGGTRKLWASTTRAGAIRVGGAALAEGERLATLPGSALVGRGYHRPLDVVPLPEDRRHSVVVAGGFVTAEDGSGLVHIAPAFGADDHATGQAEDLALVRPVAADGTFQGTTWPDLEGKLVTARETNDLLIRRLKEGGRHLATEPHVHNYPHCWRCKSRLIYYARDSWFVRTSALKDRMVALNAGVAWHPPEVGTGRFGEWLQNNVDWALSRDRYWGTPLPVWACDRDPAHVEVIGSYARLAERWGGTLPPDFDPHKPHVDGYRWTCECGGEMRRTPEVIDTWFDSGAMPYAQWHWPFEGDAEFRTHFPADFICEGVDQTRGWFYSLLALATTAFDRAPYRNVVVNELVLDAQGQKMAKSRGNAVDPWEQIAAHGADAVRLYLLASSQVSLPKRFDPRGIQEVAGGFLNTLRNTYNFLALYAGGVVPAGEGGGGMPAGATLADRWLLGRLDDTVRAVRTAWDAYDVTTGIRALMDFVVDDLSNWYVRTNRARFWAPDRSADPAAVATLTEALATASRLLAPAAPFASDRLHRALTGTSVHLAAFPASRGRADGELGAAMEAVRRAASLARAAREEAGLRVRQPLARLRIAVPARVERPEFAPLLDLLRTEVNVKEIEVVRSDADLVRLTGRPNFRALGRRFGARTPAVAAAVARLDPGQLRALEGGGAAELDLEGEPVRYLSGDVTVEREVAVEGVVQSDGPYVVALDTRLDDALRREGLARELVNRVQRLRKEAGLAVTDRIALAIAGDPALEEATRSHGDWMAAEVLARRVDVGGRLEGAAAEQDVEIDGLAARLGLARHTDGLAEAPYP
jgi:isoleucyl-tRNA synthetase